MKKKFQIVKLGDTSPAQSGGSSNATAVIATVVLLSGTALFFGIRAWAKKAKANKGARQAKVDKSALSYDKSWYTNAANSLKTAFDAVMTYDSETIEGIILQLKNADDWNQLQKDFGSFKGKGLPALVNSMYWRHDSCVNHIKEIGGGI